MDDYLVLVRKVLRIDVYIIILKTIVNIILHIIVVILNTRKIDSDGSRCETRPSAESPHHFESRCDDIVHGNFVHHFWIVE